MFFRIRPTTHMYVFCFCFYKKHPGEKCSDFGDTNIHNVIKKNRQNVLNLKYESVV